MNTELQMLIKKIEDALEEQRRIDLMATEAKREVEQILADGKIGGGEEKRYASSALALQMLPSRRAYIAKALTSLAADLTSAVASERKRYNNALVAKRAETVGAIQTALAPFFEGEPKQLRKCAAEMKCPALYQIGKAVSDAGSIPDPQPEDVLTLARNFVGRSEMLTKRLGLNF